jgi:hypothetical protein
MSETNPSQHTNAAYAAGATAGKHKSIFGFVVGAVVASAFWLAFNTMNARKLSQSDQGTLQSMRQTLSRLQSENSQLSAENQNLKARVNTCEAKFARGTFIYDIGLLNMETRVWYIPADIDPVAIGTKRGSYSHFDPKAQTETVHLQPKTQ